MLTIFFNIDSYVPIPYLCDKEENRGDPRPMQKNAEGQEVATKRIAIGIE